MLITPVQPPNSLNNIIIQSRNCPGDNQPDNSSKIQEIKSFARKPPAHKTRKLPLRDRSVSNAKKSVLLELKYQKNARRNIAQKLKNSEEHDEEMTQSKQILADILKEYEQISKDKNILTAEIKNMKTYLSDIRSKLDQSLTVLNKNTKLFAIKSGMANSLRSLKSGRAKKIIPKKRKRKTEKNNKTSGSLKGNESFLTKESLLKSTVSALKYK